MERGGCTEVGGSGLLPESVSVRPAASREELEQAFRLVYSSYLQRGYIEENRSGMRLSIFNAFPTTVTFVAALRGTVIATVSLVTDSEVGLPADEIYHAELGELRKQGRKLTEATMLADRRREIRRALPMLLVLMKRVFDYVTLAVGADDLCITINPRHEAYYEQYLLFKPLGGLKSYASVRNNPALAKRLDVDRVREECKGNQKLWRQFFENRTPLSVLRGGYRMSTQDLRYFFVESTSVFRDAPRAVMDCLAKHYPERPWEDWLSVT